MNTAEHNKLNALVNRACALQAEADRIVAELESFADMKACDRDAQNLAGMETAEQANEYRKLRIEAAIDKLRGVSNDAYEAAEICNSGLLF